MLMLAELRDKHRLEIQRKDKLIEDLSDLVKEAYSEGYGEGVKGDTYLGSPYHDSYTRIDLGKLIVTIEN
jgi:hypothetical protein